MGLRIFLSAFLLVHVGLSAQEMDTTNLDQLALEDLLNVKVSVATKVDQNVDDTPGNVIVISRQQIMDMNARTLKDVLNVFVPGMDALPGSMKYGDRVETVYSRGINSDFSQQILYLFNGKNKFNETTFGQPLGFIEFTLEAIERIEISTSPVPLQGGSAVTIINLVTRDQSEKGVELFLNSGFDKNGLLSKKATILFGQEIDGWHVGGSLQFYDDKGQPRQSILGTGPGGGFFADPKYMRDGTKSAYNLTMNLQSPNRKLEIGSWYKFANQDAYLSGILPWASGYNQNYIGSQFQQYLKWQVNKSWDVTAGYMWHYLAYPGFPFYNTQTNFDTYLEVNHTTKLGRNADHSLLVGGRLEREGQIGNKSFYWDNKINEFRDTTAFPLAPNQSRNVFSFYADDNWSISKKLTALIGIRYDHYDNYAHTKIDAINPRIALSYKLKESVTFKMLFAQAHRPPTLYELTGQTLLPLYGNPKLKLENIDNLEFNLIYKKGNFKFKISAFHQVYKDQIIYLPIDKVFSDRDTTQASNAGQTNVLGADVDLNYYFNKNSYFFLNATQLSSRTDNDQQVLFLPATYINGGFNFKFKSFNINSTNYFRGKRPLPETYLIDREQDAGGTIFNSNLSVTYSPSGKIRLYTLVQNVFANANKFPLSVDGYYLPMRGRVINVGLTVKL